jgi:hypothetical protein
VLLFQRHSPHPDSSHPSGWNRGTCRAGDDCLSAEADAAFFLVPVPVLQCVKDHALDVLLSNPTNDRSGHLGAGQVLGQVITEVLLSEVPARLNEPLLAVSLQRFAVPIRLNPRSPVKVVEARCFVKLTGKDDGGLVARSEHAFPTHKVAEEPIRDFLSESVGRSFVEHRQQRVQVKRVRERHRQQVVPPMLERVGGRCGRVWHVGM